MLFILVGEDMRNMKKADIYVMPAQTVDKLDENRVCLSFLELVKIRTLISTPGTRFPRAVREPPRHLCACGVSLGRAFPAGVSHLSFQSTLLL